MNTIRLTRRVLGNAGARRLAAAGRDSVRSFSVGSDRPSCDVVACATTGRIRSSHHLPTQLTHMRHFSDDAKGDIDRSEFTEEVKVEMPEIGEDSETLGVIEKWYKKEGDLIKRDEVICDIRTELFTFGMLTDDDYDSIMGEILVPEETDDPIEPGTVICTTLHKDIDGKKEEDEEGEK